MKDEGYFLEVGDKGKERLDVLNDLVNESSMNFLRKMGLRSNMKILEIGCGAGQMTVWLAKQVLKGGKVIAIDSSDKQLTSAQSLAEQEGLTNIEFRLLSAYEINLLPSSTFDMVFARFVFAHLLEHRSVLEKVKDVLKPKTGTIVIQDVIASHIFSYPENSLFNQWLQLALTVYQHFNKDPDIGKKLVGLYHEVGLTAIDYEYHHPLLKTEHEKLQMVRGIVESKKFMLEHNLADERTLDKLIEDLTVEANSPETIVSFMPNMIVGGR